MCVVGHTLFFKIYKNKTLCGCPLNGKVINYLTILVKDLVIINWLYVYKYMLRQWHCEVGKAGIVILTKSQRNDKIYTKQFYTSAFLNYSSLMMC